MFLHVVIRPYTPLYDDQKGQFDLLVKKYETGQLSKHFHELEIGDVIDVKGPIKKIEIKENFKKSIGMIAGGTGLTPMVCFSLMYLLTTTTVTSFFISFKL